MMKPGTLLQYMVLVAALILVPAIADAGPYGIPNECMKNSTHVDLSKIHVGKKCNGWYRVKDRAGHGGSKYKACNRKDEAVASIADDGKVLRGASKAKCF